MEAYYWCFEQQFLLHEMITHMGDNYGSREPEHRVSSVYNQLILKHGANYLEEAHKASLERKKEAAYDWCFTEAYTHEEMINYMAKHHGETKERVTEVFEPRADSNYIQKTAERSLIRKRHAEKKKLENKN